MLGSAGRKRYLLLCQQKFQQVCASGAVSYTHLDVYKRQSYGWATRIARNLHLELNIGIGLLRTDYRHYHARDNYQTLLWQENGK